MFDPSETDLLFDPWVCSEGPALAAIAHEVLGRVHKATAKGRTRQRKAEVVERETAIVSALIGNLAVLHRGPKAYRELALPLRHTKLTRYDRQGFGQLTKIVRAMAAAELVIINPAHIKNRRTCIQADGWLLEALRKEPSVLGQVGRADGEETIWLTARVGRDGKGAKLPNVPIDYEDTPEINAMREEIAAITAFLKAQHIKLDGERQPTFRLTRRFLLRSPEDPHTFTLHGRLYGGFWESLKKERRAGLRINGEPIADLDYASMFPRLAYATVGQEPPKGDLYAIPGLEGQRAAVKIGFSALLSGASEMRRLPEELKAKLPEGWTARRFKESVAAKHPALVPLFGRDIALDLMFTESRILIAVLRRLMEMDVPALPMHDGIMVPASKAGVAMRVMEEVALSTCRHALPITTNVLR